MEVSAAKIVSMLLLGGISLFLGLLPLLLKKCNVIGQSTSSRRGKFVVSALSCFGGGVILATCFTHMLPEVNTFMKKNIQEGHFPDTGMLAYHHHYHCILFQMRVRTVWKFLDFSVFT